MVALNSFLIKKQVTNCKSNMSLQNTNITSKNYKKLSIQVSLTGFSFCCFDTLNNIITSYKEIKFDTSNKSTKIEDLFTEAFKNNPPLKDTYDEVMVIHTNNLSTFVPTALFDEEYLGSYLQYNTKVFETDFFTFDEIPNYQMNSVYIPYVNINNFLIDNVGSFDYKHANSILVEKILDNSRNNDDKKMVVNFNPGQFEVIVVQNQKLLFFNSFEYQTPEDFIYYLLFTAEQSNLNPEIFPLELLGTIDQNDPFYAIAYKYIRNISFMDVSTLQQKNSFSLTENKKHYILFQS
ncbi:uncharacterized protein DUF3822 [Flavobacterium sp. 245]|nr:uncharacterized protein DUF3822 [Flavobacterium sp. 245]